MKRLTAVLALVALSGCNTFEGLGRDLAAGGEAIEGAASEAKRPAPQPVYRPVQQQPAPIYQQPSSQYIF